MIQLGVLISGRGSNMRSIVRACQERSVPAEVAIVISNRKDAPGLAWAEAEGLKTSVVSHRAFPDRESHDRAVVGALREAGVEWVCLAGYMRLLSPLFVGAYEGRILNIHPSLLPAFPGLHAQKQAWAYGVKVTGCTVHLVDVELDHGPIVVQRVVNVPEGADEDALADLILDQEHLAYPEALRMVLQRSWRLEGRRVVWQS
jgi:phosphoribosylglycinamide formyltransferase-1